MRKCVYAGSFDLLTNGHMWMIEQGSMLFDQLVVAVGINSDKIRSSTFSIDDRIQMLHDSINNFSNVCVDSFEDKFLVRYANSINAKYILRGIRDSADYVSERGMRHINQDLCSDITTVFLMPPREISEISSSLVKGLIGPDGWKNVVSKYVPKSVYDMILKKYNE